ncbi:MAG: hypothetical protein FJX80_01995 [Bacteroidetes bacterium]|nr:hypothetical protein [Bacteroidota bacterium]
MTLKQESLRNSKLFLLFNEIIKGYSKRKFRSGPIFIKHLGVNEKAFFDLRFKEFYEHALTLGILSEEEALKKVIEDGFWSEKEEEEIDTLKNYIDRLILTKKNFIRKLEIEAITKQIDEERQKLAKKISERKDVLGKTAEEYASNRSNDYIIYESLFKDEDLKQRVFSESEFEEMTYEDLVEYILFFNEYMEEFKEYNLQKIALLNFFQPYYLVLDQPMQFWGKPMVQLTDFQVRTTIYGKIFKNIFETTENIPDNIKTDPDKLFEYTDKSKAKKNFESKQKNKDKASGEAVFGATKEEVQEMKTAGAKTINEAMKGKKTMTMDELMKLHGEA